jgi:hypothetical protein
MAINPYELAQQARERAAQNYRATSQSLCDKGNLMYDMDVEGARALWLDGMHALDCAITVETGMEN